MRLTHVFTSMFVAALLLGGCTDNDELAGAGQPERPAVADGQITFLVSNSSKGVTHYPVTKAIATEAENKIDTLDVYVFGRDQTKESETVYVLETVYRGMENMNVSDKGGQKQVTLSVTEGTKFFYFVSNGRDQRALDEITVGETTKEQFREKITNLQEAPLACPLLMTDTCMYAVSDDGTVTLNGTTAHTPTDPVEILLKRRMARFDVKNDKYGSQFILKKITLSHVPERNSLFEGVDFGADTTFSDASFPAIDFAAMENANVGETPSVFYLYPVSAEKAKNVKIMLEGTNLDGKTPQVYNLELKETQETDAKYMDIRSNYRYILSIRSVDAKKLSAVLTVEDWITGDTVKVNTDLGGIALKMEDEDEEGTAIPQFPGTRSFQNLPGGGNLLTLPADAIAGDSVTITVAAESEWKIRTDSIYDWIGLSEEVKGLQKYFRVTTLKPNPSKDNYREATVLVYNAYEASINQPLVIRQSANTTADIALSGERIAADNLYAPAEGLTEELVKVNATGITDWTASVRAECTWINLDPSTATAIATTDLKLTLTENDSYTEERVDTVFIKGTYSITPSGDHQAASQALERRLVVRQAKKSPGSIELSLRGDVELRPEANTLTIDVTASAGSAWTASILGDGDGALTLATPSDGKGTGNGQITLTLSANTTANGRKDTLLVRSDRNEKIFQKVAFRQAPQLPTVAYKSVQVSKDGKTIKGLESDGTTLTTLADGGINVTGLADATQWELAGDTPAWINVTYDNSGKITIADNGSTTDQSKADHPVARTATVIFRHKDYPTSTLIPIKISQTVEETVTPVP